MWCVTQCGQCLIFKLLWDKFKLIISRSVFCCSGSLDGPGSIASEVNINHVCSCPSLPPGAVKSPQWRLMWENHMNYKTAPSSLVELKCWNHPNGDQMFSVRQQRFTVVSLCAELYMLCMRSDTCLAQLWSPLRDVTGAAAESASVWISDTLILHSFPYAACDVRHASGWVWEPLM